MTLLSASELSAIQALGIEGMTASVEIFPSIYDTGGDLTDDPYGSSLTFATTASATVSGWLVGHWEDSRNTDVGDLNTTTVYRLRLPVGTSIDVGWHVEINDNTYLVIDAGTDQTWPEWLTCVVKRVK